MTIDPITLVVLKGSLEQIVDEMDWTHERTAFSAVISEGRDRSNGIYRGDTGEVVVQGPRGHPLFTGIMELSTQAIMRAAERMGTTFEPGDVWIVNDPYEGGTHLQDLKATMPYFYDGQLIFFLSNQGHWIDMGGMVPGGFAPSATELYQEGVRVPPLKLYDQGVLNRPMLDLLMANIRNPLEAEGDLNAQLNALHEGARRLDEVLGRYGAETILEAADELKLRAERLMRAKIATIPDGTYFFEDYADNDGIEDKPVRIALNLTVDGDRLLFDFSDSDPSSRGPMHLADSSTISSCFCAVHHIFPNVPSNSGAHVPIEFILPPDSVVNASFPTPVAGLSEMCARIVDISLGALSQALPDKVPGNHFGTANNLTMGAVGLDGTRYIAYHYHGGGYGGSAESDGLIHGSTVVGFARVMPVEVVEHRYPMVYTHYGIRDSSGGPGEHTGGCGSIYEFRMVGKEAYVTVCGDRARYGPRGVVGGGDGALNRLAFTIDEEEWIPPLGSKVEKVRLTYNDRVRIESPGGGGYGNPKRRDPQLILRDVKRKYVSAEQAREVYGCAIVEKDGGFRIDEDATRQLRQRVE